MVIHFINLCLSKQYKVKEVRIHQGYTAVKQTFGTSIAELFRDSKYNVLPF